MTISPNPKILFLSPFGKINQIGASKFLATVIIRSLLNTITISYINKNHNKTYKVLISATFKNIIPVIENIIPKILLKIQLLKKK